MPTETPGCCSRRSDDTPCNGRWPGWTGWRPRCGRFPGRRGGPLASDDTPCNGRWAAGRDGRRGAVGSRVARGAAGLGRHPMQREMVRLDGMDAAVRSVPGRRGGPLASDDTPCNGRWSGWTGWTPRCGRFPGGGGGRWPRTTPHATGDGAAGRDGQPVRSVPGRGRGPLASDDTPCNGRWAAGRDGRRGAVGPRAGAGCRGLGRHPMQREMGGWTGWTPRCGRFPGGRGGPLASDDTPCNGRWCGRTGWHRGALGARAGAGVRWPRTTPHATRGGSAGRDGHLGALGARAGGAVRRPRTTPHTTGDGAVGRYRLPGTRTAPRRAARSTKSRPARSQLINGRTTGSSARRQAPPVLGPGRSSGPGRWAGLAQWAGHDSVLRSLCHRRGMSAEAFPADHRHWPLSRHPT